MSSSLAKAIVALSVAIYLAAALALFFLCDDAFIAFRYSKNLVQHGALVYNLGEYVEGYTSLLWVLAMAAGMALGLAPEVLSRALGIVCGLATITVVGAFARRGASDRPEPAAAAVVSAALALPLAAWSTGGLETTAFTLLFALGVLGTVDQRGRRVPWPALCLGLSALARPEGILGIGGLAAWRLARVLRGKDRPRPALVWLAVSGGIAALHVFWRLYYYGEPVPNTFYVKGHSVASAHMGLRYTLSFVTAYPLALAGLAGMVWGALRRDARSVALLLVTGVFAAHVVLAGGDFMDLSRFLVPLVPLLAWSVGELVRRLPATRTVAAAAALVLALHVAAGAQRMARSTVPWSEAGIDSLAWSARYCRQWSAIGRWLHDRLEPGESIITTAAGALPYYAECYTVDQFGLVDRTIARSVPERSERPGHRKQVPKSYGVSLGVNYIIGHPFVYPEPVREENELYLRHGYTFHCVEVPDCDPPYWTYYYRPGTRGAGRSPAEQGLPALVPPGRMAVE